MRVPERRILKGTYLLAAPVYGAGNRSISPPGHPARVGRRLARPSHAEEIAEDECAEKDDGDEGRRAGARRRPPPPAAAHLVQPLEKVRLLSFARYLAWAKQSPATGPRARFAVQGAHRRAGAGDPLKRTPRVWLPLRAMPRATPPVPRKLGVTVEPLEWVKGRLRPGPPQPSSGRRRSDMDSVGLYAALLLGFFFLARSGE